MKNRKRQMQMRSFYDRTGIEAHLRRMAREGWMLEKPGQFFWTYRRIEKKDIHFSVVYFPKASEFDPRPTEEQEVFTEFCAGAGWKSIGSLAQMQIFYNEGEDPLPIETDPVLQTETVHRAMKKNFIPAQLMLLLCALLQLGMLYSNFRDRPLDFLSSNGSFFSIFCWLNLLFLTSFELGCYFHWYKKAKRAALEEKRFIPSKSYPRVQYTSLLLLFFLFGLYVLSLGSRGERTGLYAGFLYVSAVVLLVQGLKNLLKKLGVETGLSRFIVIASSFLLAFGMSFLLVRLVLSDRGMELFAEKEPVQTYTHRGIEWEFYRDPLPLTVSELLGVEGESYSRSLEVNDSLLLHYSVATDRLRRDVPDGPDLVYSIVKPKVGGLYSVCRDSFLDYYTSRIKKYAGSYTRHYRPLEPPPCGALEAYRLYDGEFPENRYLLCFEDLFVEFDFGWEADLTQLETACEKIRNSQSQD